jgi:hypothetical protein
MATDSNLSKGDKVKWNTSQGETKGEVKKRITDDIKIKDNTVKASKDNPKYVVESDKTGNEAAHKPDALKKA